MSRIRKLYLQNDAGQRWGLNGDRGVFASNLAGFGLSLTPSFANIGGGFFVPVSDESEPQATIPFTLTFTRAAYQTYTSLVNWLAATETVTLIYAPVGSAEYYRDVTVNFLQKSELTPVGWLEVPCSFFCSTPWYLPKPTVIDMKANGADESMRYDYYYTDALCYGEDNSASMSTTISGAGHIPGALTMSFVGAITNPRIRLTGNISGKTVGICSIEAVLLETDILKFSSRYENSYVKKVTATGEEIDLLDSLDLSLNPFFHVPVSEPCSVTLESASSFTGTAELLVYYYYRSV